MVFENKLKKILSKGHLSFGSALHIPAVALIEIMGKVGYDFIIIDTEHGLYDIETAGKMIRVAQTVNLVPIVRVLKNDEGLILRALDLGAQGVIIPHVSSKKDASKAVEACKYGIDGRRGACPLVRSANYGLLDWPQYEEDANRNTMVFLLVEDLKAAYNIEDILSIDGVDAVFLGPFDMSVSAGYKGNVNHPEIQKALDNILAACKQRKIPVMHAVASDGEVENWIKRGVRLFVQSADSFIFAQACAAFLKSVSRFRNKEIG